MLAQVTTNSTRFSDRRARWAALRSRCALAIALTVVVAGCGRAGGAPDDSPPRRQANKPVVADLGVPLEQPPAAPQADTNGNEIVARLEGLLKRGAFDAFVDAALRAADEQPDNAAVEVLKAEALLAIGRAEDAALSARTAARLAIDGGDYDLAAQALRRWATARFRASEPLEGPWFAALSKKFPPHDATITMLRFWSDSLGQRMPYASSQASGGANEVTAAPSARGADSAELGAITARVNGVALDTVFIDTGAQHTVMTIEAAHAAGVRIGPSGLRLVGFAKLAARPGLLDTLDLGGFTLHDVPVLIGDSAPLAAAGGQMALGTELMHHVRFTIDYPANRVLAEPAGGPRSADSDAGAWQIPLWTFSQACLAQGQLPLGATARVLVDTGNGSGTYVSTRWARRHVPGFPRPHGPVVFKHTRKWSLDKMEIGTRSLEAWPVVDTLPAELERADAVDVLVGRDLLAAYRVTIDVAGRTLWLERGSASTDATSQAAAATALGTDED